MTGIRDTPRTIFTLVGTYMSAVHLGPLYPMSFTVPPEGVGPVPVTEVLPLLVNDTLDASRRPVFVPPLTVKLACPYGAKASPVNVPEPLLVTLIPPAVA